MKKILTIIGNRPQLMKIDPFLKQTIIWTGQHYDKEMKDIFLKELKLPKPKYNLKETQLGAMIDRLIPIIYREKPDYVMVYGDTNSTLAGAIAAKQCKKKLIHVEAGMRSNNLEMLEEQNRRMVDQISDILLCPSFKIADKLEEEKVLGRIGTCGNVMIDTIWEVLPTRPIKEYGKYYLLTLHRAETVDDKESLKEIFEALGEIDGKIIFPMHPRTKRKISEFKIKIPENVIKLEPVGYKEMINFIGSAAKVITDSGGIQVEAHFLRIPCITLRNETEWTETLENGWNILAGTDKESIIRAVNSPHVIGKERRLAYGEGKAKERIRNFINSL